MGSGRPLPILIIIDVGCARQGLQILSTHPSLAVPTIVSSPGGRKLVCLGWLGKY